MGDWIRLTFNVSVVTLGGKSRGHTRSTRVYVRRAEAAQHARERFSWEESLSPAELARAARSVAVERGLQKLYGRRAYWWGDSDPHLHDTIGQIAEPMPKGENGSRTLTGRVRLDVSEVSS